PTGTRGTLCAPGSGADIGGPPCTGSGGAGSAGGGVGGDRSLLAAAQTQDAVGGVRGDAGVQAQVVLEVQAVDAGRGALQPPVGVEQPVPDAADRGGHAAAELLLAPEQVAGVGGIDLHGGRGGAVGPAGQQGLLVVPAHLVGDGDRPVGDLAAAGVHRGPFDGPLPGRPPLLRRPPAVLPALPAAGGQGLPGHQDQPAVHRGGVAGAGLLRGVVAPQGPLRGAVACGERGESTGGVAGLPAHHGAVLEDL